MANEILSVKLSELDDRISHIHGRIHLGESYDPKTLGMEIKRIEQECKEMHQTISDKLHHSRSSAVMKLAHAYDSVEDSITELKWCGDKDKTADEKILIAEYALDFALLAADSALYKAFEAIKASREDGRRA